jgi:SAM-dependent methyltransferase
VIIIKADALHHPFADGSIDLLSCEQSIHHTDQPGKIFDSLSKSLSSRGKVLLSVYAEKSAIREKFDAIIREGISGLSSQEKHEVAKKITDIAKILSEINVDVEVPEEYHEFGDLKGEKMSLQRFMYYAVMKCFWNDDFTYDKCVEFNHDWYSYPICNTVSLEEASSWFERNNIKIDHVDSNSSNVNIRGNFVQ